MKIHVAIDDRGYTRKPDNGQEIHKIKERASKRWGAIEVESLADQVGNKGYAMLPAHLEGGYRSENCTELQVLALDFDSNDKKKVSFSEIKEKCDRYGLRITFAYHTLSSSNEFEKFRVVFIHEYVIKEPYIAQLAIKMLMRIFPESDAACKNLDRVFLGGKKLIYCDPYARVALVQLLPVLYNELNAGRHVRRNVNVFCDENNIAMLNGVPLMGDPRAFPDGEIGAEVNSSIYYSIRENGFAPFFVAIYSKKERKTRHQSSTCKIKPKYLNLREIRGCELLKDFLTGVSMSHNARFQILTNLRHINGGQKLFMKVIQEFYGESFDKWKLVVKYADLMAYNPQRCSAELCPYYDTCNHEKNILETLSLDRKIYKTSEEKWYSIEEANASLKENIERALLDGRAGVHLIQAQTALGKTTAYIEAVKKRFDKRVIIAVPTIILRDQVYNDLKWAGIPEEDIFKTPSLQDINYNLALTVGEEHERGLHGEKRGLLKEYLESIEGQGCFYLEDMCKKAKKGVAGIKRERIIVTTHAYFIHLPQNFLEKYEIIIDEDILQLYFAKQIKKISVACLEQIVENRISGFDTLAERMLAAREGEYISGFNVVNAPQLTSENWGELAVNDDDNINDLTHARAFVKLYDSECNEEIVRYFCPPELPKGKCIILSATLNEELYQAYCRATSGVEVYTYPQKKARYKGKIKQHTYHSLGRADVKKRMSVFSKVREEAGTDNILMITFKKLENELRKKGFNISKIHFGNSTGINELKGKNLAIVGTPFEREEAYKLLACFLGAEVNSKQDERPKVRRVEFNGYSFLLTTYQDRLLQIVQLHAIHSELEQCVGRARLLRYDCTVYVYSAFPCEQAEINILDYLTEK